MMKWYFRCCLVLVCLLTQGCEVQHQHQHHHDYGTQPIIPRDKDGKIIIEIRPSRQQPRR